MSYIALKSPTGSNNPSRRPTVESMDAIKQKELRDAVANVVTGTAPTQQEAIRTSALEASRGLLKVGWDDADAYGAYDACASDQSWRVRVWTRAG